MKLGQLQEEISKASLPVSADLSNDFKTTIFGNYFGNSGFFGRSSKNVYNLLKKKLHITP